MRAGALKLGCYFAGAIMAQRIRLAPATIFDYGVQCSKAIAPANFFALFISATVVGNSHFKDPTLQLSQLCDNFRLNAKTIFFDLNRFDKRSLEGLVAGLHVRQVKVSKHVGKQGQKLVDDHMPEKKDAMRSPAHEAGAENCVRFA